MPPLNAMLARCEAYGLAVRFADLGDWGSAQLRSEYDPSVPEIRIDRCLPPALAARAIAHELYHHREALGEVERLQGHRARETAADEYARELIEAEA